jgi:hypothetical protein
MPMPLPQLPSGLPVGTYSTYAEAQRAVDYLSDNGFPVENVALVGTDLRLVEQVTGRLTRGRVILAGALGGAMWGLFIGIFLLLFGGPDASGVVPLVAGLLGLLVGAVTGAIGYAATKGERDFTSNTGVVATSYQVLSEPKYAEDARNLLAKLALRTG